jgi:hypothetical protein
VRLIALSHPRATGNAIMAAFAKLVAGTSMTVEENMPVETVSGGELETVNVTHNVILRKENAIMIKMNATKIR